MDEGSCEELWSILTKSVQNGSVGKPSPISIPRTGHQLLLTLVEVLITPGLVGLLDQCREAEVLGNTIRSKYCDARALLQGSSFDFGKLFLSVRLHDHMTKCEVTNKYSVFRSESGDSFWTSFGAACSEFEASRLP